MVRLVGQWCPDAAGVLNQATLGPLVRQSDAWARASDASLRAAVEAVNAGLTPGRPRAAFAGVTFGANHCYAAPDTWLWRLGEEDAVMKERLPQCLQFAPLDPTCPCQAAFHPNARGARAYAAAISRALEP